jgi:hypothetical protein
VATVGQISSADSIIDAAGAGTVRRARVDPFRLPAPNLVDNHLPPAVHHLFAVGWTPARPVQVFQPLHGQAISQTHRPLPPQLRDGRDRPDRFEGEEGFSEKVWYGMVSPANQQTSKGSH